MWITRRARDRFAEAKGTPSTCSALAIRAPFRLLASYIPSACHVNSWWVRFETGVSDCRLSSDLVRPEAHELRFGQKD
jgi:hypothetical protein